MYLAVAGLAAAITEASSPAVLASLVASGICVDLLLAWLAPGPGARGRQLAFGALAPLVTWALYLGFASAVESGPPAVVELWTGVPIVAAGQGLLLGALVGGGATPAPEPRPSTPDPEPGGIGALSRTGEPG